jgi:glycosyltransferase involved in cell wall biosynthesis
MKRIIVLTSRYPFPVIGGDRLRIYNICKNLSKNYSLTLVSLTDKKSDTLNNFNNHTIFNSTHIIYLPKWKSYFNLIFKIFSKKPLQVSYYQSQELSLLLNSIISSHDAILCHLIRTADYINQNIDIPSFIDMTDSIAMNYKNMFNFKSYVFDFRKYIYAYEYKKLLQYEIDTFNNFIHCFLISKNDLSFINSKNNSFFKNVSIVSNGVDFVNLPYNFNDIGSEIIFIGNMNSFQNLDAILYFCKSILPIIVKSLPDIKVKVIGRIPKKSIKYFNGFKNVKVTGEVDSVSNYVQNGGVGICPVRLGAGVQNKILEYFSFGLPVVSTALGADGINADSGFHLFVEDDPESFAHIVVKLIKNRSFAQKISYRARKFVEANHDWNKVVTPFSDIISHHLTNPIKN